MITNKRFHIAIPTAFDEDESLNTYLTIKHLNRLYLKGVDTVLLCGSTGEQHSMSLPEKIELLHSVDNDVSHSMKQMDVIWGVASIRQTEAVALATEVKKTNVKAILLGFPPYILPSQDEALKYAVSIIDKAEKPVIIYNNPGRTGFDLSIDSIIQLCRHPLVFGIKEAGDINKVSLLAKMIDKPNFLFFAGGESNLSAKVKLGFNAISSMSANIDPVLIKQYFDNLMDDVVTDPQMESAVDCLVKSVFESNPIVNIKKMLNRQGYSMGKCRSPLGM